MHQRKKEYFLDRRRASIARPTDVVLTPCGKLAEYAIQQIPVHYPSVSLEHYTIMPNHIHLLLQIHAVPDPPSISTVVQQMKGFVTKQIGHCIWQKLYHDHVIRSEKDYQTIWAYIDSNPVRWSADCFYIQASKDTE